MMGDAVKWLERDLREVVRSYFQPLRSIGRDIRDALTKDDPTPAAAQVLYREIPDDGKPAQRWYQETKIRFYIRRLPTAVCFVGIVGILGVCCAVLLSSIHDTTPAISALQYKILVISAVLLAIGWGVGLLMTIAEGVFHLRRKWGIDKHKRADNR